MCSRKRQLGLSRLDVVIIILIIAIGIIMLIPIFQKSDDVLVKQSHRAERFKFNTQIELYSMDNDGVYPKSMKPKDWVDFQKYFPDLQTVSSDPEVPLYCNQGNEWQINPDHKLSLLGHGNHE